MTNLDVVLDSRKSPAWVGGCVLCYIIRPASQPMERDELQELLEANTTPEHQLEKMRTAVTILFSDIKGSTAYFEKHGDVAGMAMVERHNNLLFPPVAENDGRVVK